MNNKKCPLMSVRSTISNTDKISKITTIENEMIACLEDDCAWYDYKNNQCGLLTIAFEAEKSREALETSVIKH